ncbi:MAG: Asp-tRNA(Asn)/Glu-tRNA(Gln) amidotransferase subunit GatC [Burkholderiales bacterium]
MPLTPDEVRRIATLARIELSQAEVATAQSQLNSIFGLIERLQATDTQGVTPMSHAGDASARLRDDKVSEGNSRERFQSVAPQVERGLYLVPKVIE